MTPNQQIVLEMVRRYPRVTASFLRRMVYSHKSLQIGGAGMSVILRGLEKKGYVKREVAGQGGDVWERTLWSSNV